MNDKSTREQSPTREERLAAKLRENLRRRKQQARDVAARVHDQDPATLSKRGQDG